MQNFFPPTRQLRSRFAHIRTLSGAQQRSWAIGSDVPRLAEWAAETTRSMGSLIQFSKALCFVCFQLFVHTFIHVHMPIWRRLVDHDFFQMDGSTTNVEGPWLSLRIPYGIARIQEPRVFGMMVFGFPPCKSQRFFAVHVPEIGFAGCNDVWFSQKPLST